MKFKVGDKVRIKIMPEEIQMAYKNFLDKDLVVLNIRNKIHTLGLNLLGEKEAYFYMPPEWLEHTDNFYNFQTVKEYLELDND